MIICNCKELSCLGYHAIGSYPRIPDHSINSETVNVAPDLKSQLDRIEALLLKLLESKD